MISHYLDSLSCIHVLPFGIPKLWCCRDLNVNTKILSASTAIYFASSSNISRFSDYLMQVRLSNWDSNELHSLSIGQTGAKYAFTLKSIQSWPCHLHLHHNQQSTYQRISGWFCQGYERAAHPSHGLDQEIKHTAASSLLILGYSCFNAKIHNRWASLLFMAELLR